MMGELLTRFLLCANPSSANFHKNSFWGLWGCSLQHLLSRTHQTGESGLAFSSRFPWCPLCAFAGCRQQGGGAFCCSESLGKADGAEKRFKGTSGSWVP